MSSNDVEMAMQRLCDDYGFELIPGDSSQCFDDFSGGFVVCSHDEDGELAEWFAYDPSSDKLSYMNTDHNNLWLYINRPDLSANDIVAFLSEATLLMDAPEMTVADFVDPEDWQELPGGANPISDVRYQMPLDRLA